MNSPTKMKIENNNPIMEASNKYVVNYNREQLKQDVYRVPSLARRCIDYKVWKVMMKRTLCGRTNGTTENNRCGNTIVDLYLWHKSIITNRIIYHEIIR